MPSPVVGARKSPDGMPRILIVDGFDRFDSGLLHWVSPHSSLGNVVRMDVAHMNPGHLIAEHGRSIHAAGYFFDGVLDEGLDAIDLEAYDLVVWGSGEESTQDESLSHLQQERLREFLNNGGALFLSGSEIMWDLDAHGDEEDRAFVTEVLQTWMTSDASGTDVVDPVGVLKGVHPLDFGWERGGLYPVEWADVLDSDHETIAVYGTDEVAGVLGAQLALFGFPFETVADPVARDEVMARLLPELLPGYTPPVVDGTSTSEVGVTEPGDTSTSNTPSTFPDDTPGADSFIEADPHSCGCQSGAVGPISWIGYGLFILILARRQSCRTLRSR